MESKHDNSLPLPDRPQTRVQAPATESMPWVPETRFGKWFVSTDIWRRYVVAEAIDCLAKMSERAGIAPQPNGCIMDIGCGGGGALELLAAAFQPDRLLGVDIDETLISHARRRHYSTQAHTRLEVGSVYQLDLDADSVDAVFCHQLLHHLTHQSEALAEIYRVLKPGGVLLLSESCRTFIRRWWVRWFFRHPDHSQKSAAEYKDLVTAQGFKVSEEAIDLATPWWADPWFNLGRSGSAVNDATAAEFTAVALKPSR